MTASLKLTGKTRLEIREPSGLYFDESSGELWVVCDRKGSIYRLKEDGRPVETIALKGGDLEGVTKAGKHFFILKEEGVVLEYRPSDLKGGKKDGKLIRKHQVVLTSPFGKKKERRFEGITYDHHTKTFYLLHEKKPRLLLQCNRQFREIRRTPIENVSDLSGISYDSQRKGLWMISHESKRLFFVNLSDQSTTSVAELPVRQAEGVAVSGNTVYIVGDRDRTLFRFELPISEHKRL